MVVRVHDLILIEPPPQSKPKGLNWRWPNRNEKTQWDFILIHTRTIVELICMRGCSTSVFWTRKAKSWVHRSIPADQENCWRYYALHWRHHRGCRMYALLVLGQRFLPTPRDWLHIGTCPVYESDSWRKSKNDKIDSTRSPNWFGVATPLPMFTQQKCGQPETCYDGAINWSAFGADLKSGKESA